jgi:hypothetical protein
MVAAQSSNGGIAAIFLMILFFPEDIVRSTYVAGVLPLALE